MSARHRPALAALLTLLTLLITGAASVAGAQTAAETAASTTAPGTSGDDTVRTTSSPLPPPYAGFKQISSPASGAEIRSGKGEDEVTLKVSYLSSRIRADKDGDNHVLRFRSASVLFSTPLNKKTPATELLTLDGMATASSIAFAFSNFTTGVRGVSPLDTPAKDAICKRVLERKNPGGDNLTAKGDPKVCLDSDIHTYGTAAEKADWRALFFDTKHTRRWVWGGSAKVGFPKYDYIQPARLEKESRSRTPWSLGAYVGYTPAELDVIFSIDAKYQKAYEEGDQGVLCPVPGDGATSVPCVSGAIGEPARVSKKLLAFDVRRDFGFAAAGLTVTHEFVKGATSVELPVYLLKGTDGALNGGIKFGWRSDTKEYGAGVFVGTTFDILK